MSYIALLGFLREPQIIKSGIESKSKSFENSKFKKFPNPRIQPVHRENEGKPVESEVKYKLHKF